ncbi:MAG TPA: MarR family transcriptional regulator [Candidatus Elarobacter sp.]
MADRRELEELLEDRDVSSHLLTKLKHAQLMSRAALEDELARMDLTISQFLALATIERNPEISSAELARQSYVSPQAMMTIVARMETAKLIVRKPSKRGGRALHLALTADGARLLEEGRVHAGAIERYLVDTLGAPEYRRLLESLDTITAALGSSETTRTAPWHSYARADAGAPAAPPARQRTSRPR